ncbi:restriction endonuclease subunit S [Clostridium perfringens]|nr:restriction endonuclease subunit S [Clostridium perfringens]
MNNNVPKLRFKGFEDEWKEYKLGDLFNLSSGGTPSRSNNEFWDGDIPWVTTGEIDFNVIKETKEKITSEAINNSSAKIFPVGTILIAMYGQGKTRGKSAILGIEATTNQACAALMSKEKINKTFAYQYISGNYENIRSMCNVGGQKNLSLGILNNFNISVSSLQEQEKIANFLSKVDSIIEKQEKKVEYWNSYKKGIMQKIFSQRIRFKDENEENYPAWEEKKLGSLGQTYTGLSGKTKEDFGFGDGKYITYLNVFKNTKVDINMFDLVDIKEDEKQNKVLKGDILFTTSSETPNEVGMASVCDNDIENLYLNSFCFGFRLNANKDIDYIFIGYLLRSPSLRRKISILAQGSTRYNLSKSELMKMKIQIPHLEEQRKIVDFISNIDSIIEKETQKLEELRQLKKGLLQQMLV